MNERKKEVSDVMPTISVIIPTYGNPRFLDKSILSVLNQTYQDIELIVVDDNDSDSEARALTEHIISCFKKLDPRIKYLKHSRNMNGAAARNTGLSVASGKYISFLDSDDEYMPERLQKCLDIMEIASETVAGVYTGCEFRQSGVRYASYKNVKDGNYLVETLACKFMFCTGSNLFVRKSVANELNGFDASFIRHQDYEFLVRLFENYSLKAISEILVIKNNENPNLPSLEKQIAVKNQYLTKFRYIILSLPQDDVNYIMRGNYINIAENAMRISNNTIANEYYNKAKQYGPLTTREWFRKLIYPLYNIIRKRRS